MIRIGMIFFLNGAVWQCSSHLLPEANEAACANAVKQHWPLADDNSDNPREGVTAEVIVSRDVHHRFEVRP
jgi:hypothetical protein